MWWWWIVNIFFELFDIKINTVFAIAQATSTAHIKLGNLTPFDGEIPPHLDLHMTNNLYTFINTETVMSFWLIFRHYLHRKLSKCNFWWNQWWKFSQNDDISVSVNDISSMQSYPRQLYTVSLFLIPATWHDIFQCLFFRKMRQT